MSTAEVPRPTSAAASESARTAVNRHLLARHLPNAQLRFYADAGHGFLDQYPEQFGDHVRAFLNGG